MATLQQIADIIVSSAGWSPILPAENGAYRFSLEGDLDFELLSPENRTAILYADLGPAPSRSADDEEQLRRLSSLAAGALKTRRTVFSIADERLELHLTFALADVTQDILLQDVRDFLNDLAWWKKQLNSTAPKTSSDTFSFGFGGWFPGN